MMGPPNRSRYIFHKYNSRIGTNLFFIDLDPNFQAVSVLLTVVTLMILELSIVYSI